MSADRKGEDRGWALATLMDYKIHNWTIQFKLSSCIPDYMTMTMTMKISLLHLVQINTSVFKVIKLFYIYITLNVITDAIYDISYHI